MKANTLSLAAVLGLVFSLPAAAVPINATFNGTVSGSGFFPQVLNDFPIGTAASFNVTFDDSGLVASMPLTDLDPAPVSGSVQLGASTWTLDAGHISQYSFSNTPGNPILWYQLQLTGSGPIIGGNGSLFGLFLVLTPSLTEAFPTSSLFVGFGYSSPGVTSYSYADLTGTFATTRSVSVPEPATAFLLLPAFAMVFRLRAQCVRVRSLVGR